MSARIGGQTGRLVAFFILAFAISWAVWLPAAAASRGLLAWSLPPVLSSLLGAFGPTLAAVIVALATGGLAGLRRLLGRLLRWRAGLGWYAFALFWPPAQSLAVTALHVLAGGAAPDFAQPPVLRLYPAPPEAFAAGPWPLLPLVFAQQLLLGSAMGEEPGWRGFALPRLQGTTSALTASLILGAAWGIWHLPLFWTAGQPYADTSFGWFLLGITGAAVLYTWLFNNTGGSLIPVLLLHAATATTGLFLAAPDAHPALGAAVTWAVALFVLLLAGPARLSRAPEPTPRPTGPVALPRG